MQNVRALYHTTPSLAHSCKFSAVACFIALETQHDGYLFNCLGSQRRVSHVWRVSFLLANLQFSTVWVFRVILLRGQFPQMKHNCFVCLQAAEMPQKAQSSSAACLESGVYRPSSHWLIPHIFSKQSLRASSVFSLSCPFLPSSRLIS